MRRALCLLALLSGMTLGLGACGGSTDEALAGGALGGGAGYLLGGRKGAAVGAGAGAIGGAILGD